MRIAEGNLWTQGDGLELVFQVWRRWAVWHGIDKRIVWCKRYETGTWDESMVAKIDASLYLPSMVSRSTVDHRPFTMAVASMRS